MTWTQFYRFCCAMMEENETPITAVRVADRSNFRLECRVRDHGKTVTRIFRLEGDEVVTYYPLRSTVKPQGLLRERV